MDSDIYIDKMKRKRTRNIAYLALMTEIYITVYYSIVSSTKI